MIVLERFSTTMACGKPNIDQSLFNCDGTCVDDPADSDDICEVNEVIGCMVEAACNYNPKLT